MKTVLDLPDDLLIEAKIPAASRKTTLKAIVEHALRREIRPAAGLENPAPEKFEVGPLGLLVLKGRHGVRVPIPSNLSALKRKGNSGNRVRVTTPGSATAEPFATTMLGVAYFGIPACSVPEPSNVHAAATVIETVNDAV